MRRKNKNYYIRKSHRYLGVVLGVQFLCWTLGGLYFSWNDLDKVHGDHLRKEKTYLPGSVNLASPQLVLDQLQAVTTVDAIQSLQLIELAGKPVYQVRYFSGEQTAHSGGAAGTHSSSGGSSSLKIQLAHAETGNLLTPLTASEAVQVALQHVAEPARFEKVAFITDVNNHHEYRGKPLPAWAVTFKEPGPCTVYISSELGTFQAIRHDQWRLFDFLWMLHTMDYQGRDNFGNILLKAFSVFGLLTILSGFVLFFVSSPRRNPTKVVSSGTVRD